MNKGALSRIALGLVLVIGIIITAILVSKGQFSVDSLVSYVDSLGYLGVIAFIVVYAVGTVFAFPGSILTIAGGYLFNSLFGFISVIIGASIGALMAFLISRYLFHDYFHKKFSQSKLLRWSRLEDQKKLTYLVLVTRLIPLFPFNALNYGFGLTKVKARNYFLASMFGMMPGTFVYVFLGSSLNDIFSLRFIGALLLIVVFSVATYFIKKRVKFKEAGEVDIKMGKTEVDINKK